MIYVSKKKEKIRNQYIKYHTCPRTPHGKVTKTQENNTYKWAMWPTLSHQVTTMLQWTDKTAWQTQNINNKKVWQRSTLERSVICFCSNQRTDISLCPRARPLPFLHGLNYWVWYGFCICWQWQEISTVGMEGRWRNHRSFSCLSITADTISQSEMDT